MPVLPQALLVGAQAASDPDVTGEHVPTVLVRLQAWQAPVQAVLQQTPSTQVRVLPQAPPVAGQACPATHPVQAWVEVLQPRPLAQSVSTVHIVRQAVPLQVNVPQGLVVPAAQTPAPLHVPAVVIMKVGAVPVQEGAAQETAAGAVGQVSVPLQVVTATDEALVAQEAARQTVSEPRFAQTPPAAQEPVLPQVIAAAAGQSVSDVPTATPVQVPAEPVRLQAMQAPVQAVLQQTPSAQFGAVLSQSEVMLHIAPGACFVPHFFVTVLQVVPTQSVSALQVVPH
jgi:hypothetical protein